MSHPTPDDRARSTRRVGRARAGLLGAAVAGSLGLASVLGLHATGGSTAATSTGTGSGSSSTSTTSDGSSGSGGSTGSALVTGGSSDTSASATTAGS